MDGIDVIGLLIAVWVIGGIIVSVPLIVIFTLGKLIRYFKPKTKPQIEQHFNYEIGGWRD